MWLKWEAIEATGLFLISVELRFVKNMKIALLVENEWVLLIYTM